MSVLSSTNILLSYLKPGTGRGCKLTLVHQKVCSYLTAITDRKVTFFLLLFHVPPFSTCLIPHLPPAPSSVEVGCFADPLALGGGRGSSAIIINLKPPAINLWLWLISFYFLHASGCLTENHFASISSNTMNTANILECS